MTKNYGSYKFGIFAEKIAIIFLRLKFYQIIAWRCKTNAGEIDIIAKKSRIIVFIEVKARKKRSSVEEVLRTRQINRMRYAAEIFIAKNPKFHHYDRRFDFIEVGRFLWPKHHRNFIS